MNPLQFEGQRGRRLATTGVLAASLLGAGAALPAAANAATPASGSGSTISVPFQIETQSAQPDASAATNPDTFQSPAQEGNTPGHSSGNLPLDIGAIALLALLARFAFRRRPTETGAFSRENSVPLRSLRQHPASMEEAMGDYYSALEAQRNKKRK